MILIVDINEIVDTNILVRSAEMKYSLGILVRHGITFVCSEDIVEVDSKLVYSWWTWFTESDYRFVYFFWNVP